MAFQCMSFELNRQSVSTSLVDIYNCFIDFLHESEQKWNDNGWSLLSKNASYNNSLIYSQNDNDGVLCFNFQHENGSKLSLLYIGATNPFLPTNFQGGEIPQGLSVIYIPSGIETPAEWWPTAENITAYKCLGFKILSSAASNTNLTGDRLSECLNLNIQLNVHILVSGCTIGLFYNSYNTMNNQFLWGQGYNKGFFVGRILKHLALSSLPEYCHYSSFYIHQTNVNNELTFMERNGLYDSKTFEDKTSLKQSSLKFQFFTSEENAPKLVYTDTYQKYIIYFHLDPLINRISTNGCNFSTICLGLNNQNPNHNGYIGKLDADMFRLVSNKYKQGHVFTIDHFLCIGSGFCISFNDNNIKDIFTTEDVPLLLFVQGKKNFIINTYNPDINYFNGATNE